MYGENLIGKRVRYNNECKIEEVIQHSPLPTGRQERKDVPITSGVIDYFPGALAEVAKVSRQGNIQHDLPEGKLQWDRSKSADHADCITRHLIDRGKFDSDGFRHSAKMAWRALALLQEELELEGAVPGRASLFPPKACEGKKYDPLDQYANRL